MTWCNPKHRCLNWAWFVTAFRKASGSFSSIVLNPGKEPFMLRANVARRLSRSVRCGGRSLFVVLPNSFCTVASMLTKTISFHAKRARPSNRSSFLLRSSRSCSGRNKALLVFVAVVFLYMCSSSSYPLKRRCRVLPAVRVSIGEGDVVLVFRE